MIHFELGANCFDDRTEFAVFAPYAKSVKLRLFKSDDENSLCDEQDLRPIGRGCFGATVEGNLHGLYYTYLVDGRETVDPYARSCGANTKRGLIFKSGSADPEGWERDTFVAKPPIVWEVHVRDFSAHPSLHLRDAGKYTAFASGVTLGDKPVLIDYVKRLGVTYVQLMPTLDFGSVDECGEGYNWGYDPMHYFIPEGSYSSDPHDGFVRVKELKQLVMNLHSAGIGVILDVVYNHTYFKKGSWLDCCAPDYYYRMSNGSPANGSGCGNETRSESVMFSRMMTDSVVYLAKEYHIDGFRFDLMGLHDVDTMNRIRRALDGLFDGRGKDILMYGEPWYCFPPHGVKGADKQNLPLLDERIGVFNDVARDAIRGSHFGGAGKGFVQGRKELLHDLLCELSAGQAGEGKLKLKSPAQQVLYAACHDNYTLFDQLTLSASGEDVRPMQRMAGFLIMSGLGIPFLQAGEEFLRSKGGDGNSYRSGDGVNALDWEQAAREWNTVEYYRGLIEIRKRNHAFDRLSEAKFVLLDERDGAAAYKIGDVTYCVNNSEYPYELRLKSGILLADIQRASADGLGEVSEKYEVPPRGVAAIRDKT